MTRVRPFAQSDIPQVADLFLKVFGRGATYPLTMEDVTRCLAEVFVNHPWRHEGLTSFVCESSPGRVVGFLGVTPRRMRFKGRSILVAVSAHLMVCPDQRPPLAGVQLQQALFAGPQDLAFTDGATDQGRAVWTGLGGAVAPVPSVSWLRPLRPTALAASAIRSRWPMLAPCAAAARFCSPLLDGVLARQWPDRFRFAAPGTESTAVDTDTIVKGLSALSASETLWPEYDARSMAWLLARAGRIVAPGILQKAVLRNPEGKLLGWYLYHLNPTGVSEVLQIVADKDAIGDVFDHLSYDAWSRGAIGLGGRVDLRLVETLGLKKCVLTCGHPWVLAHSRDPDLLETVCQGRAFLTRLDGEWSTSVKT